MSKSLDEILASYVADDGGYKDKVQALGLIVVDRNGKTLYSKSLGKQSLTSESGTFTHDSVCWIASMTKVVTAVCCMQLVEQGRIGIDDDVGEIVPELKNIQVLTGFDDDEKPILEDKKNPITLRNLLTHSSGFGYSVFDPILHKYFKAVGREMRGYKTMEDYVYPLKFQPGEGWEYGIGIDWAGRVLEVLTGKTLEEYMQAHIFQPLGMSSTTMQLQHHPDLVPRRAEILQRNAETGALVSGPDTAPTSRNLMGGGGGLFSTTADYAKFLTSLITNDAKLLKPASLDKLFSPEISERGREAFQAVNDKMYPDMYPNDTKVPRVSHAFGGALNLEDIEGKRLTGTCYWGGMTNPAWWLDQKSGIAGVLMVQILPPGDKVTQKIYDGVERAVYKDLVK